MSKRDPEIAFHQILSHAREAVELCNGKSRTDLDSDRLLNLALTRLIEIIGEAANRIPFEIQNQYSDIPWFQMVGAQNRLIHGYDSVDFDILWMIVKKDLPGIHSKTRCNTRLIIKIVTIINKIFISKNLISHAAVAKS